MKLFYKYCGESRVFDFDGCTDLQLKFVYDGLTLVTEEGERLSVAMRDSGFEVHYYTEEDDEGKGFDIGWVEFKCGSVGLPDFIVNDAVKRHPAYASEEEARRLGVWCKAKELVDELLKDVVLAPYRTGAVLGQGTTMTVADQRVSLVRDVATWLLGEE